MAAGTYAEYLVGLTTGLAVPSGTYAHGEKILWGDKVMSMLAPAINGLTRADIISLLPGNGTNADKERAWLVARGAPVGTIADMRKYLVINSLMP